MPKMKTKSGAKKRFKVTAGGVKRRRAYRNHILTKKTTKLKRQLRTAAKICKRDVKSVLKMLKQL